MFRLLRPAAVAFCPLLITACAPLDPPPPPRATQVSTPIIELILEGESGLPAAETARAVRDATVILGAVSGIQFEIRESPSRRITATACRVEWRRWVAMPKGSMGQAHRNPCRVLIGFGGLGIIDEEQLRCVLLHELWHLVLPPHWHSERADSVMAPEFGGRCLVTPDVVAATEKARR